MRLHMLSELRERKYVLVVVTSKGEEEPEKAGGPSPGVGSAHKQKGFPSHVYYLDQWTRWALEACVALEGELSEAQRGTELV